MALNVVVLIGLLGCKNQIDETQTQSTSEEQTAQPDEYCLPYDYWFTRN